MFFEICRTLINLVFAVGRAPTWARRRRSRFIWGDLTSVEFLETRLVLTDTAILYAMDVSDSGLINDSDAQGWDADCCQDDQLAYAEDWDIQKYVDPTVQDGANTDSQVNAGYNYSITYGHDLELSGNSTLEGEILAYNWDINGDGEADVTGESPVVSWETLKELGVYQGIHTIQLAVEDLATNQTETGTARLEITPQELFLGLDGDLRESTNNSNGHGSLWVTRNTSVGKLTVSYAVSGTATNGDDFGLLGGVISILPGKYSREIPITVTNDSVVEGDETIIVTLKTATEGEYSFSTRDGRVATTIEDNDSYMWDFTSKSDSTGPIGPAFLDYKASYTFGGVSTETVTFEGDLEVRSNVDGITNADAKVSFSFNEDGRISVSGTGDDISRKGATTSTIDYSYTIDQENRTVQFETKSYASVNYAVQKTTSQGGGVGGGIGNVQVSLNKSSSFTETDDRTDRKVAWRFETTISLEVIEWLDEVN